MAFLPYSRKLNNKTVTTLPGRRATNTSPWQSEGSWILIFLKLVFKFLNKSFEDYSLEIQE